MEDISSDLSDQIITLRVSTFRRMLFEAAEAAVTDAVTEWINDCKNSALEDIDNILCMAMTRGAFDGSDIQTTRDVLKAIILINKTTRDALDNMPFPSKPELLEAAQEVGSLNVDIYIIYYILPASDNILQLFYNLLT